MSHPASALVACPECDALMREPRLPAGGSAHCHRCGARLFREKPASLDRTLAFLAAAAVLFAIALSHPLMRLDANGITTSATLREMALALREHGMASVGILVLVTTIVVPALQLAFTLAVLVPLRLGFVPDALPFAFRLLSKVWPWGMVDVFIVGTLVSFVKLRDVATVEPGIGLYAIGGYVVAISAAVAAFEPRCVWEEADRIAGRGEARAA